MPTRVLFVRHGDRDHSAVVANNALIPLTAKGHEQAGLAGAFLASTGAPISAVVSSPFLRCLQTTQGITKALGIASFELFPLVGELHMSHDFPEDSACHLPHASWPHFAEAFPGAGRTHVTSSPPFPEGWADFPSRLLSAVRALRDAHPDGVVICVTHGCFLEYFAHAVFPGALVGTYPGNTCVADVVIGEGEGALADKLSPGPLGAGVHLPDGMVTGTDLYPGFSVPPAVYETTAALRL